VTNEEILLRYAARIAFAAQAEMDARPKPIVVAVQADEPRPELREFHRAARWLH
jgi:hypothetical protein